MSFQENPLPEQEEDKRKHPFPSTPHPFKKRRGAMVAGMEGLLPSHVEEAAASVTYDGGDETPPSGGNGMTVDTNHEVLESGRTPFNTPTNSSTVVPNNNATDEEPDWDKLSQHEPAKTDVATFLQARATQDAADERFAAFLDDCHASFKQCLDDLLQTAADVHTLHRERLDALEGEIRQTVVWNEEMRSRMHQKLEEGATAAQGLFSKLLQQIGSAQLMLSAAQPVDQGVDAA